MSFRARLGGAAALLSLLILAGCQDNNPNAPARVTGRVTYNGSPVTGGSVSFHYKEGGMSTASIAEDGTYSAVDIPVGEATVTVETESLNPDKPTTEYKGTGGGPAGMYGKAAPAKKQAKGMERSPVPEGRGGGVTYVKIPKKYSDPATSGLTYTVVKGKQSKDFALTD